MNARRNVLIDISTIWKFEPVTCALYKPIIAQMNEIKFLFWIIRIIPVTEVVERVIAE